MVTPLLDAFVSHSGKSQNPRPLKRGVADLLNDSPLGVGGSEAALVQLTNSVTEQITAWILQIHKNLASDRLSLPIGVP